MVDRDDDLRVGIKSTAILFGKYDVAIIGLLQLATLGLLAIVGWLINGALVYWLALLVAAGLFIWQFMDDPQSPNRRIIPSISPESLRRYGDYYRYCFTLLVAGTIRYGLIFA